MSTIFTWEYGSTEIGLVFTIIYDSKTNKFTVNVTEGYMELNALWFSNGDEKSDGFSLKKSDNSLNMIGMNEVWSDDGSSEKEKIVWDDYLITSATNSSKDGYVLAAGGSITFDAPADFDPIQYNVLGVNASNTSAGGSIKWADADYRGVVFGDSVQTGSDGPGTFTLIGDAEELTGRDAGGDDILTGGANADKNLIYGDAVTMRDDATGGDDVITGGANAQSTTSTNTPWQFGNFLYGDALHMYDNSVGGNDIITGGANSLWDYIRGDAFAMYDSAKGGNDVLTGGEGTTYTRLYGDAAYMYDNSVGGDDTLNGSDGASRNLMMGDAFGMYGSTVGGDDYLVGGDNVNSGFYGYDQMFGDAVEFGYFDTAVSVMGGNDILVAGSNSNTYMTGDAQVQGSGTNYGGDDILIGGDGTGFTVMTGDVDYVYGGTIYGGNDRLESGSGTDYMWGDFNFVGVGATAIGGSDNFVFHATNNGHDFVYDFEVNKDKLEFIGLTSADLGIDDDGTNTTIIWDGGSVTVLGVTQAHWVNDFLFA